VPPGEWHMAHPQLRIMRCWSRGRRNLPGTERVEVLIRGRLGTIEELARKVEFVEEGIRWALERSRGPRLKPALVFGVYGAPEGAP
jgi:hypothetical protein